MNKIFIYGRGKRPLWKGNLAYIPRLGEDLVFTVKGILMRYKIKEIYHLLQSNKVNIHIGDGRRIEYDE